jgi:hypothetical protein
LSHNGTTKLSIQFNCELHIENGVEVWYARELQTLLGYKHWQDFEKLVTSTKKLDFNNTNDHIRLAPKLIIVGKGAERKVIDYILTRTGADKFELIIFHSAIRYS